LFGNYAGLVKTFAGPYHTNYKHYKIFLFEKYGVKSTNCYYWLICGRFINRIGTNAQILMAAGVEKADGFRRHRKRERQSWYPSESYINKNDVIVATAKHGKGAVFAVGDPWFYNEYVDGRKLPPRFENFNAANDLVRWVVQQISLKK
jgi:hypothetical protein